jgi:hypothetical protein
MPLPTYSASRNRKPEMLTETSKNAEDCSRPAQVGALRTLALGRAVRLLSCLSVFMRMASRSPAITAHSSLPGAPD